MRLPEFCHVSARWDIYKEFYCDPRRRGLSAYNAPLFVQLLTGELLLTRSGLAPSQRRGYPALGLHIGFPGELPFQFFTPDGEKVPLAWLNQGGQPTLVVDMDHGKAFLVSALGQIDKSRVPKRFWNKCAMYWGGEGCEPVSADITLSRPYVPTPEEKEHVRKIQAQCTAWRQMKDLPDYPGGEISAQKLLDAASMMDLAEPVRMMAGSAKIAWRRVASKVPWLKVELTV